MREEGLPPLTHAAVLKQAASRYKNGLFSPCQNSVKTDMALKARKLLLPFSASERFSAPRAFMVS